MVVLVRTNAEVASQIDTTQLLDLSLAETNKAKLRTILNTVGQIVTDHNTILHVINAAISFHDYNMAIKKLMQIEEYLNEFTLTYSFCNLLANNFDFHVKHIKISQQNTYPQRIYQLRGINDLQLLLKIVNATPDFQLDRKTVNLISSLTLDFNGKRELVAQIYHNLLTKSERQAETSNNEQKQLLVLKTLLAH